MILRRFPRSFYGIADALAFAAAFGLAYLLVPVLQGLIGPGGALHSGWYWRVFSIVPQFGRLPPAPDLIWIYLVTWLAAVPALALSGCYAFPLDHSRIRLAAGCCAAAMFGVGVVALISLLFRSWDWSRLFIFDFAFLGATALAGYRLAMRSYFNRRWLAGHYARNVLLIGRSRGLDWMRQYFRSGVPAAAYRLLGYLTVDGPADETRVPAEGGLRCLGAAAGLGDLLVHQPIHDVILIDSGFGREIIEQAVRDCDYLGTVLRIVPEALLGEGKALRLLYHEVALNLPAITIVPAHWESEQQFFKRLFDLMVSAALLVVLSPLFLVIAAAIKVTMPGAKVFYPWKVVGKNGAEFTGYKFTTMVADADARKASLMQLNEMTGPVFKIERDPRVTKLGRLLRKFSLNELPQLWSVLKGDMSLVGPRPAFPHELARYEYWHKRKLSIRPGMTCLWQVRGRNKINDFNEWVRMDLEYIDNWSLWLDFKILVWTAWVVVAGTGS